MSRERRLCVASAPPPLARPCMHTNITYQILLLLLAARIVLSGHSLRVKGFKREPRHARHHACQTLLQRFGFNPAPTMFWG